MAGIIVAICIFLIIGIIVFLVSLQLNERKILRNFYDILFLTNFFEELKNKKNIKRLLRDGTKITITRKLLVNNKIIEHSKFKLQKKYEICYVFKIDDKSFEFCEFLDKRHKKMISLFLNTKFELEVKKNKIDLQLNSFFSEFICVTSVKTIVQSIWILLDSASADFEKERFFFCSEEEIEAAENIIEKIKEILSKKLEN